MLHLPLKLCGVGKSETKAYNCTFLDETLGRAGVVVRGEILFPIRFILIF